MDKINPLSRLMVVKSLNMQRYLFHIYKDNGQLIDHEVTYLSAISALIYLSN